MNNSTQENKRPVALVTGGSRGIGFGCAEHLAKAGFDVAINGMRPKEQVSEPIEKLEALGAKVVYCRGDIGSAEARAAMLAQIKSEFGRLNVLVNNAGVAPKERKDILEASEESFDYVVGTNLKGPYFLTQSASNWMVEQRADDPNGFYGVINVGSVSATVASVNRGEYCVAKAGIAMMTALFAARLGEYNIPVYEIRPGVTKTDMTSGVTDKYDKMIEDGLCVTKRWGFPADVGKAVTALARGDFPYSTGQVILVDGGLTLPRL
ncbi:3-ketoacyl-ACP reductase [Rubellicoccus peritrichatus]|uniref:3-ketoacyl-ACP reductase n=1 Tax=Rubellicoccus peritrichatus TaxID=3080537 RepID=A0AAQ3QRJ7_9BACT|nr:3-ketoacyl-ACP reductase [Puniceicoccus sp. CR14]WOO39406.1 3-ketoacyl-ACP reductase [Puniceicoccus sp. CR14]